MKSFMIRLSEFLTRRRWFVLAAWLVIVVLALPLASKQTENLVAGGFEVPGSQSQVVEDALSDDFDPAQSGGMGVVLTASDDATPDQIDAGVARLGDEVAAQGDVTLTPRAAAQARAELRSEGVTVVPLTTELPASKLTDSAADLRELSHQVHDVDLAPVDEAYAELVFKVRDLGVALSDRRAVKVLKLVAASALLGYMAPPAHLGVKWDPLRSF